MTPLIQISPQTLAGLQLAVGILTVLAAALGSWIGIKVALAEIKTKLNHHEAEHDNADKRLTRLEDVYFRRDHSQR